MILVDKCKEAKVRAKNDKFVECEACGKYFLHDKKGRKPKTCSWYKKQQDKELKTQKEAKEKAKKNSSFVSIPKLEQIESIDLLKEDMLVYYMSDLLKSSDAVRRQYASEYKILEVNKEKETITVIRNAKLGHKNYPIEENFKTFYLKNGYTYTEKVREENTNE